MMIYDKVDKWLSTLLYMHRDLLLEIEADTLHGVGAHLGVGHLDMGRMSGVSLESLGTLEGAVEHYITVGRVETTVNIHLNTEKSGHSEEQLQAAGIAPDLIRLSVGIEDVEDIIADIRQAMDKCF